LHTVMQERLSFEEWNKLTLVEKFAVAGAISEKFPGDERPVTPVPPGPILVMLESGGNVKSSIAGYEKYRKALNQYVMSDGSDAETKASVLDLLDGNVMFNGLEMMESSPRMTFALQTVAMVEKGGEDEDKEEDE